MSAPYFAGLDIGGTTVKSMLLGADGLQVGPLVELRSHVREGYKRTFEQLDSSLAQLCSQSGIEQAEIAAIGLDVPAPCCQGVIWGQANLSKDWVGTDIGGQYEARCGKPVTVTNDGNAAAYGEWLLRPGRQAGLLFVAPGTGLGGGLVLPGGVMYEGANGLALEVSDLSVPFEDERGKPSDSAGREGCLEAWVSLVGIRRQLELRLLHERHREHPLNQLQAPIEEKALKLRDYAEKGDGLALEIFQEQARILGYGLADMASLLDPGLMVIGGGLAETGFRNWYLDEVREGFNHRAAPFYKRSPLPPHDLTTTFEWAVGGDSSAAYGSARRALDLFQAQLAKR
ncbi:MAG: ROK family protein [Verrucomicrobia bacterium]|nr:ROK family protein [Verrucomicrobiota bacterium]